MQKFWATFEFIALTILFVLQIYFLLVALKKMKMMSDFFPDIKSIHIKRIVIDKNGNEIKDQSEDNDEEQDDSSILSGEKEENGNMTSEGFEPKRHSTPSVKEMRSMKVEDLRPYVKFVSRAYWSRTASEYCMAPEHIVAPNEAIASIKSSYNEYSIFVPAKKYTVGEFEDIMSRPNVYANRLFDFNLPETYSTSAVIKVLAPGRCVEDDTKWKVVSKCKISI